MGVETATTDQAPGEWPLVLDFPSGPLAGRWIRQRSRSGRLGYVREELFEIDGWWNDSPPDNEPLPEVTRDGSPRRI